MSEDTYKSISVRSEGLFKDRGSKFIGIAVPVETEDEVKEALEAIRKEYYDARHHCYAYRLKFDHSLWRVNDDGEPSSSAGRPIFGQIQSYDLTNILIVVVRYFGGTKLGVPGLINAYRTAAKEAIEDNTIEDRIVYHQYDIHYEYAAMNDVMKIIKDESLEQLETQFDLKCRIRLKIRMRDSERITEKLGKINTLKIEEVV